MENERLTFRDDVFGDVVHASTEVAGGGPIICSGYYGTVEEGFAGGGEVRRDLDGRRLGFVEGGCVKMMVCEAERKGDYEGRRGI